MKLVTKYSCNSSVTCGWGLGAGALNLWGCLAGAAWAVGIAWKLANLEGAGAGALATGRLCLTT